MIEVPSWGPVTLIEAIWLLSGLLALFVTAFHLSPLYDDWITAKSTGRVVLEKTQWGYLRREVIRMLQGVCLTVIGVYAAAQPSPIPGPAYVTPVGLVLTGVLLALSFLVSAQSLLDWRMREQVDELIAHGANGHHKPQEEA